ncbi:unnamed protein product, partial [Prorocentrum cordatum]
EPEGGRRLVYPVPKTVFSADRRLLVVLGLEGTGHHFFVALLSRKKPGSSWASRLGSAWLKANRANGCSFGMGLACMLDLTGNWNQWNLERQVRDASKHKASPFGPVGAGWSPQFVTNVSNQLKFAFDHNPGWIVAPNPYTTSWPNGHGTHEMRKLHMGPNVLLLAQAAEMAGADMRVIPMHRDPAELLLADCRHRHDLEGCPGQADTLATNARAYADQMRQLDPAFYAGNCIQYHELDNITRGIQHALAGSRATLGEDVATAVRGAWLDKHRDPKEALQPDVQKMAEPIRPPLEEVLQMCRDAQALANAPQLLNPPDSPPPAAAPEAAPGAAAAPAAVHGGAGGGPSDALSPPRVPGRPLPGMPRDGPDAALGEVEGGPSDALYPPPMPGRPLPGLPRGGPDAALGEVAGGPSDALYPPPVPGRPLPGRPPVPGRPRGGPGAAAGGAPGAAAGSAPGAAAGGAPGAVARSAPGAAAGGAPPKAAGPKSQAMSRLGFKQWRRVLVCL